MKLKAATANIRVGMSHRAAQVGLERVLDHRPDIVALQEWPRSRNSILKGLKTYRWVRSPKGGGPVLYGDRFGLLSARSRTLARRSFMGRLRGRKSSLPASIAGEFRFSDDADGCELVVVNFHLTAEVQYGGKYRTDRAHAARVRRHKREVRSLERIIARNRKAGRRIVLLGDTNYDGLRIKGVTSCWHGHHSSGTLGGRTVDHIYARPFSDRVTTIATGSDHRGVVALYR